MRRVQDYERYLFDSGYTGTPWSTRILHKFWRSETATEVLMWICVCVTAALFGWIFIRLNSGLPVGWLIIALFGVTIVGVISASRCIALQELRMDRDFPEWRKYK